MCVHVCVCVSITHTSERVCVSVFVCQENDHDLYDVFSVTKEFNACMSYFTYTHTHIHSYNIYPYPYTHLNCTHNYMHTYVVCWVRY